MKSPIEKALEKQQREMERLERKRRMEAERMAHKEAMRLRASTIVSGQPIVGGLRMLDATAEKILRVIVEKYYATNDYNMNIGYEEIEGVDPNSLAMEFEKLVMYGVVSNQTMLLGGHCILTLSPQGLIYFEDKEKALEKEKQDNLNRAININSLNATGSNIVLGNIINSSLSIDNTINNIENKINELGGEDKESLREVLGEVKEMIGNMEDSRYVPKNKGLWSKVTSHMEKHSWFYGEVVGLLGSQVLKLMQG